MILHMKRRQMLRSLNTTTRMHCVNHKEQRNKGKGLLLQLSAWLFRNQRVYVETQSSTQVHKGPVIKYLLGWAGGKIESFSKSLMAQPERNKKFLWPTSMAEKFFMAHPYVVELVTKGY